MPKRHRDDELDDKQHKKIRRLGVDGSILAKPAAAEPAEGPKEALEVPIAYQAPIVRPQAHRTAPSIPWCLIEIRSGIYRSLGYYNSSVKAHISNRVELKALRTAPPAPDYTVELQTQKERLTHLKNWEYNTRGSGPQLDRRKIKALICPTDKYYYVTPAFLKGNVNSEEFTETMRQGQLPHKLAENADRIPSSMVRDWRYHPSTCFRADAPLPTGLGSHDPFDYTDVFVKQADGRLGNFYAHLIEQESADLDERVLDTLGISKADYKTLKLRLAFGPTEASDLSSETSEEPLEIVAPTPDPCPSTPENRHGTRIRVDRGR